MYEKGSTELTHYQKNITPQSNETNPNICVEFSRMLGPEP